jgi:hypothetical protein
MIPNNNLCESKLCLNIVQVSLTDAAVLALSKNRNIDFIEVDAIATAKKPFLGFFNFCGIY